MADFFDTEQEGDKVLCTLPMDFFGYGNVEVEIKCTQDECTLTTKALLPVTTISAAALENSEGLYELVGRFYSTIGAKHFSCAILRHRDFTYPNYDARHWGLSDVREWTALYSYGGVRGEADKLEFNKGDTFELIEDRGDGWSRVRAKNDPSKVGLVPSNYIVLVL